MKKTLLLVSVLTLAFGLSARAQLIDVQFGGNSYNPGTNSDVQLGGGQAVGSASGDKWNDIVFSSTVYNTGTTPYSVALNNVGGTSSGVTLSISSHSGLLDEYSTGTGNSALPGTPLENLYEGFLNADSYQYATPTSSTFTFSGLTAGLKYNLYIYSAPNRDRSSDWAVTGGTSGQVGTNNGATTVTSPNNYILLTGVADGSNDLVVTATSISGQEIDVNGFQLQAVATPEPTTYALLMLAGFAFLFAIRRKASLAA